MADVVTFLVGERSGPPPGQPTPCPVCTHPFTPTRRGRPQLYCSRLCQRRAGQRRAAERSQSPVTAVAASCQTCGTALPTGRGKQARRYCSNACVAVANSQRTKGVALVPRQLRTCERCGASFLGHPPGSKAKAGRSRANIYCSRACATQARTTREPVPARVLPPCTECGELVPRLGAKVCGPVCRQVRERRRAKERYDRERLAALVPRKCLFCQEVFTPVDMHGNERLCSAECRRRYHSANRDSRVKARARKRGVPIEPVNRVKVFQRDGWRCQCCGIETPRELLGTRDVRAPELDHVVPLALGGPHAVTNVQLTCRRCNRRKGRSTRLVVMRAGAGIHTAIGGDAVLDSWDPGPKTPLCPFTLWNP